jgi:UDP-glucose 4-epimerase
VIWITGAQGFIGRHVALYMAARGHRVFGIGHGIWPELEYATWGLTGWVSGSVELANLELMSRSSGLPDKVFHLAGGSSVASSIVNPLEDFQRTVAAMAQLLEWLRTRSPATSLVAVSSAAVYGSRYSEPIPEDGRVEPFSPYGHHKLVMEQLCRSYVEAFGLRCSVIRLFSVYGPWLKKQLLWDICTRLHAGQSEICLGGSGKELRDWTDVRDVARLFDILPEPAEGQISRFNGGSGIATSVARVASLLIEAWGNNASLSFTGIKRPGDPSSLVADGEAVRSIGFEWQIGPEQGFADYVTWFKQSRANPNPFGV